MRGGGGGGAVRFRPDTKSGGGGGGGCCPFKARYEKRRGGGGDAVRRFRPDTKCGEGGGGCLVEEGALPYMKGGVATPKPPPCLDPPLLKKGSAFENRYALCCYEPEMTLKTRPAYKR